MCRSIPFAVFPPKVLIGGMNWQMSTGLDAFARCEQWLTLFTRLPVELGQRDVAIRAVLMLQVRRHTSLRSSECLVAADIC
jgi:hypothetical protein